MYSSEILLYTATIRVNSTEINLNFTARETGLRAIAAPSYKQPSKLSQLQKSQLNLLTVTFLVILKLTEIILRWVIVDGCVETAKDLIAAKIRQKGKKRARGRYGKKLDGHVRN